MSSGEGVQQKRILRILRTGRPTLWEPIQFEWDEEPSEWDWAAPHMLIGDLREQLYGVKTARYGDCANLQRALDSLVRFGRIRMWMVRTGWYHLRMQWTRVIQYQRLIVPRCINSNTS